MPVALGIESRVPGLVRFASRAYKDPAERVSTRSGMPMPVALGMGSRVPSSALPTVCGMWCS